MADNNANNQNANPNQGNNAPKPETTVSDHSLKVIKKAVVNKRKEAPKMVSIAIDGYGNRVFVSEKKEKQIKAKLGLK